MSRATNDLNQVRMVLGPGIMYSATTVVTMVLAVVLDAAALAGAQPLGADSGADCGGRGVVFRASDPSLYEKFRLRWPRCPPKRRKTLPGVRVIRAYAQEEAEMRGFDAPNREYVTRNLKLISTWSMFMPALTALIGLTFVLVLWYGGGR